MRNKLENAFKVLSKSLVLSEFSINLASIPWGALPTLQLFTTLPKHLPQSAGVWLLHDQCWCHLHSQRLFFLLTWKQLPDFAWLWGSSRSWIAQFVTFEDILLVTCLSILIWTDYFLDLLHSHHPSYLNIMIREGLIEKVIFEQRPAIGRENSRQRKQVKRPWDRSTFARGPVEWAIRVEAMEIRRSILKGKLNGLDVE